MNEIQGHLRIFGYPDTPAPASVLPRSVGWRAARAGARVLAGLVAAPLAALIPPHAAWALGAAATGLVLGARKWSERRTLVSLAGACPRCGAPITLDRPVRLRDPFPIDCTACHHSASLHLPRGEASREG